MRRVILGNGNRPGGEPDITLERHFPFELSCAIMAFGQVLFEGGFFDRGQFVVDQPGNQFLCFIAVHRSALFGVLDQILAKKLL